MRSQREMRGVTRGQLASALRAARHAPFLRQQSQSLCVAARMPVSVQQRQHTAQAQQEAMQQQAEPTAERRRIDPARTARATQHEPPGEGSHRVSSVHNGVGSRRRTASDHRLCM